MELQNQYLQQPWNAPVGELPPLGKVVRVSLESGKTKFAFLDYPEQGSLRSSDNPEWISVDGKFVSVLSNRVMSWRELSEAERKCLDAWGRPHDYS